VNQLSQLLDNFILDKALYELLYELNNRAEWVRIPLRSILSSVTFDNSESAEPLDMTVSAGS
jgi:predicted trehalose synthase